MADTAENNVTPISADSKLSDEQKREQLRARIEAGEQRNEERSLADQAKDAADSALEFTRKHPLAVVGGVLVVGLAIGAMTRPGRRLGRRGGVLAGLAADAALAYGARMVDTVLDGAQYAGDRIEDLGDSASTAARGLRRDAGYKLDVAGDALRSSGRKAGRKGSRAYRALRTRITH
ncbi:MAG: hypothetical protein AB3N06_09050 [Erythrobacter sp.]